MWAAPTRLLWAQASRVPAEGRWLSAVTAVPRFPGEPQTVRVTSLQKGEHRWVCLHRLHSFCQRITCVLSSVSNEKQPNPFLPLKRFHPDSDGTA